MTYHINDKTKNANKCAAKDCDKKHFETKEAAVASLKTDSKPVSLKKESKVSLKKEPKVKEVPVDHVEPLLTVVEDVVVEKTEKAKETTESVVEKLVNQKNDLVKALISTYEELAKVAPKHDLVKNGKKLFKKAKKKLS